MVVFDGVRYSLSPSLAPTRRNELASILDLNGAVAHPPYTHLIALPASHAHDAATKDPTVKLVTDRWVDRSVVLGKCQSEQFYSPDPAMIFSGVVACATDLSAADLEVLSAGITALGGQWRGGLTRDVTHLFALREGSDKYNTALHFAPQTHMCIVTPHWFDDAVRLGRRVPDAPYSWPNPQVLRPGASVDVDDDGITTESKRKRGLQGDTDGDTGGSTNLNEGEQIRVWAGRRILLSTSLELGVRSRGAIEAGIRRAGGIVVAITDDADEDAEDKAVDECDVLVTRWRSGKSYFKAARASLLIGTLSWLFSVESSGALHSPLDSLLWYPTPRGGIPDLSDWEISVTNYTGAARDYLKRLILLAGAKFTPTMSQSNKVLVAGFQPSPKTTRALSWNIPVVNHTWLEDCIIEWRALTVGLERYIVYPPGIDFGKMLMTRQDEPPASQAVSAPRASGGAVPGGRGVGTIDVEQEEVRDAKNRARARARAREEEILASRYDSDVESRARSRSRAGSVKKTPLSARAKRGSISTPKTASAMGAFVDHVVALPEDDDVGAQRSPADSKRRAETTAGKRARSRSSSRASSEDPFLTTTSAGAGGAKGVKESDKGKGKNNVRQTWPAEEEEDDVAPPPHSKAKPGPVHQGQEPEENDQAPSRANKPRRQTVYIDSESGPQLDMGGVEESDASVPPRKAMVVGSRTPIKSGMKPRPRSKSASRPGESEDEVRKLAAESGAATGSGKGREQKAKSTRDSDTVIKKKEKTKTSEEKKRTEKMTARPRSPTRSASPISTSPKTVGLHKRRLSVVVPSVPKDYFSSQGEPDARADDGEVSAPKRKPLAPASSIQAVAAEASTSTSAKKRGRPPKSSTTTARKSDPQPEAKPKPKSKPKPVALPRDDASDTGEDVVDTSMIVEIPLVSTGRGGPKRGAASKATTRLREEIMPDVISFEYERKIAKRKRSMDWESTTSVREDVKTDKEGKHGKKRKVAREEAEEEIEVVSVVSAPSVKAKAKVINGKGKGKVKISVDSDSDMDDLPPKNKVSPLNDKKGSRERGKESATIRLMTTGVSLSDDVVKRLTKLGVQMTTKPTDCTHLVAKGIVRTEKFLCAMSISPYILTEEWANASAKGNKILPEKDYALSDTNAEHKWAFKFADALVRAKGPEGGPNLFKGMTFYVTPKISVDAKLLKNVVSAGGGQVQTGTTPTVRILKGKPDRYVVSCEEDSGIWRPLVRDGFKVYSPELLLRGALRQEMEWDKAECVVAG